MPKKKYVYTPIENVNTLRLPVNFAKLKQIFVVEEAYYILSTKSKKKAVYVVNAIKHYENNQKGCKEIEKAIQRMRIANVAKELFKIETETDAEKLLSISPDSDDYRVLSSRIPPETTPAKMLMGFKVDDEESVKIHKKLFEMSANERIMLISNAVVGYVLDGCDPEMERIFAIRFVLSVIKEYANSDDKQAVLRKFMLAINFR